MKGSTSSGSFVDNYLLYLLAAASESASAQFHNHVRGKGVRVPEWRVLACLYDWDGGAMVTHLAKYAMIEQSRLTKIIGQMEKRGLLFRKSDTEDGRKVRIRLTESGRKIAEELVADAKAHEQELVAVLKGSDGERIKTTLKALIDRLGNADNGVGSNERVDSGEHV